MLNPQSEFRWISNTATTAMMVPIVLAVMEEFKKVVAVIVNLNNEMNFE